MAIPSWAKHLAPRQHKYHAQAVSVDGVRFPSKREARRWEQLKLQQALGLITRLARQVPLPIQVVNLETGEIVTVARYYVDFTYDRDGRRCYEDAKGMKTETYLLKKKLVEAQHGVRILEV